MCESGIPGALSALLSTQANSEMPLRVNQLLVLELKDKNQKTTKILSECSGLNFCRIFLDNWRHSFTIRNLKSD